MMILIQVLKLSDEILVQKRRKCIILIPILDLRALCNVENILAVL